MAKQNQNQIKSNQKISIVEGAEAFIKRKTELVRKNLHTLQRVMAQKIKHLETVQQVASVKQQQMQAQQ